MTPEACVWDSIIEKNQVWMREGEVALFVQKP